MIFTEFAIADAIAQNDIKYTAALASLISRVDQIEIRLGMRLPEPEPTEPRCPCGGEIAYYPDWNTGENYHACVDCGRLYHGE